MCAKGRCSFIASKDIYVFARPDLSTDDAMFVLYFACADSYLGTVSCINCSNSVCFIYHVGYISSATCFSYSVAVLQWRSFSRTGFVKHNMVVSSHETTSKYVLQSYSSYEA